MSFDFKMIEKHPYTIGGVILVVGGIVFYAIAIKGRNKSAPSDGSGETTQLLQAQTAQQITGAQVNGQLQAQELQAQVASYAINRQVGAYESYLETQKTIELGKQSTELGVANIQAGAYIGIAQIQADVAKLDIERKKSITDQLLALVNTTRACETRADNKCRPWSAANLNEIFSALQGQGAQFTAADNTGGFNVSIPGVGSIGVKL